MKTTPYFSPKRMAALASLLATPLQAQSLAGGYSNAVGFGAMGGLVLLLLAWGASMRRQLRRVIPQSGLSGVTLETPAPANPSIVSDKEAPLPKEAEARLASMNKQLMEASRQAGMAEMATIVLHNVGNVLNSVNVSASVVADKVKNSKSARLAKAAAMLREHEADLGSFLTNDPKGSKLPAYFGTLAACLADEQNEVLAELSSLRANIEHIKEIVAMQQAYATVAGQQETLNATDLLEDALRLNAGAFERHHVQLVREYAPTPAILVDKHKVLQILVNLLRNAKYALDDGAGGDKRLTLRIAANQNGSVRISVTDNGVGIEPGNLTRIFEHGFTTRKSGHGFALHSGALAARQMGGTLTCHSAGPGQGAAFTLELPPRPPEGCP